MKSIHAKFLAVGCVGVLSCSGLVHAQEEQPTVVKPYEKTFILFAGQPHSIYVPIHPEKDATDKAQVSLDSFTIGLGALSQEVRELPELKLDYGGTRCVMPARKVIVVPPEPKKDGIFVQSALDPNGTGNYEVILTINWSDWPDEDKRVKFRRELLPETLEVIENGASWSHPKGGLSWTGTFIFHNRTGHPFILDAGYFENLPTTEGWPDTEIPVAN